MLLGGWVVGAGYFKNIIDVLLNHQEMAGRWLGDGRVVAPGILQRLRV